MRSPTAIQTLTNGLAWYALVACVVGVCISSALWAMGSKGQNPGQELTGKRGIILCCTAAFFVGALPGMINWLEREAQTIDPSVTGPPTTTIWDTGVPRPPGDTTMPPPIFVPGPTTSSTTTPTR